MIDYSVVTYITGNYENVHPIAQKSDRAEYLLITDNPRLKDTSNSWEVIYDRNLVGLDPFRAICKIRYNIFDYIHTNIAVKFDSSGLLLKSLDPVIDFFNENKYDICVLSHPIRNTMFDEAQAWVTEKHFPKDKLENFLKFIYLQENYNPKEFKSLFEYGFQIQRRNKINEDINRLTYAFNEYLGDENSTFRVDQMTGSFIINKYFKHAKVMTLSEMFIREGYFNWVNHGTNDVMWRAPITSSPHLFNQPVKDVDEELSKYQ